jgi:hypothetical protein
MNGREDKDLVKRCLAELSARMGYADPGALAQRDYEHLCETVAEKTGVLISLSTIKRIFAGKFERSPQTATLNALTQYMGYGGWQDFKAQQRLQAPRHPLPVAEGPVAEAVMPPFWPAAVVPPDRQKPVAPLLKVTALLLLVSLGVLVFFLATKQKELPAAPAGEVVFAARKAVPGGVPNSVVFSYNVDHVAADSFFIQQSWDPSRRVTVGKKAYTQTDIYYEPGYHQAKLIADGRILKEIPVSIPTEGWMAYSRSVAGGLPQYITTPLVHDGRLGVPAADLSANGIDPREDRYYLYSFFPAVPDGDGGDFTLRARLRMRPVKPVHCPRTMLVVYCENGVYYFKNTLPGCISEIDALFMENHFSGKKHDLSGLGLDVLDWYEVALRVHGQRVELRLDGKVVLRASYTRRAGPVKGFNIISNGLCEADHITLLDAAGKAVYAHDFDAL